MIPQVSGSGTGWTWKLVPEMGDRAEGQVVVQDQK